MIPAIPGLASALLLTTGVVCGLLALAVVGGRSFRIWQGRSQEARRVRVRPLILNILDGEGEFELGSRDRKALIVLAAEMARQVRGADRTALTGWLVTQQYDRECLKLMRSSVALTRARALNRFAPMAHLAPRVIARMLADKDLRVRSLAAQIAGLSGSASLVPPLLRSVVGPRQIPTRIVSMAVLRAAPSSITGFGDTVTDSNDRVRALAIDLAGQLNLADARRAIEAGLQSASGDVRLASIRSIQRLGSPLSLPALEQLSKENPLEYSSAQEVIQDLLGG